MHRKIRAVDRLVDKFGTFPHPLRRRAVVLVSGDDGRPDR
jgi:hypothetical protein